MKSLRHLSRLARRLSTDDGGVSAVEFALILPVMLLLYLGGVQISQAVSADRKITLAARTIADLTSRYSQVSDADVANILSAGAAIMVPFSATPLAVTVSCLTVDATGKATVYWSKTVGGPAIRQKGDVVTLKSPLNTPSTSVIWSEVTYGYKPAVGYVITGTLNLHDEMYMRPRVSDTVTPTNF
jgi:Flp pilus assembly protein TadG